MLIKCKNAVLAAALIFLAEMTLAGWTITSKRDFRNDIREAEKFLQQCFNAEASRTKLKKYELTITDNGFFRLRKFFYNGKQEYYSFNLRRVVGFDYMGSASKGTLLITTKNDDVIVQSFIDPKGDIDSMSNVIEIPLKNIEAEQLNVLYTGMAL